MPEDLLEFHEAVNSLQQQEEDVIEEHRELVAVRNADFVRFVAINRVNVVLLHKLTLLKI